MFMGDMPELMEIILNNLNRIIFFILVCTYLSTENITALLKILAKNATKINSLKLYEFYSDSEPELIHALICIIKSQEQLRQFSLLSGEGYPKEYHGIISALESQQNSLQEVLINCCSCSTEFKYSKILQKSGTVLQRLSLVSEYERIQEEPLLLETLKSFCPNITYLSIGNVGFSTQYLELISNLQKLQFLTLCWIFETLDDEPELLVMQLAKLLPLTLQYLDLSYSCIESFTDILLSNCYAPLKYLLIECLDDEEKIKALTEFCIRKKTLNYVGVHVDVDDDIKKKVEEYVTLMPYDRIVVNC
ncbi:hypothetical protein F8M41_018169 [Gigaspora margarita]|uniref:Uncharacterized protein n=1 Tax=Gigaspora margarita TaxID=4874 RepID=A0A8H4ELI1_GIGMA|nr:hypothetical protein F8M41_018169 [Gigaspora margarita]